MANLTGTNAPLPPVKTVCKEVEAFGVPFEWHPLPLVIETEGDSAWMAWDAAVRDLDCKTPEGRAMALANA